MFSFFLSYCKIFVEFSLIICIAHYSFGALSSCPDESWPASVTVTRTILKDGFHRELLTTVKLRTLTNTVGGCSVLIKELLPAGLFADPYQLASLREYGILEALLLKPVDIEAPEYLSSSQTVLVYLKPDPSCTRCYTATVPVHGRYHRPSEDKSTATITLENPKLLLHCLKGKKLGPYYSFKKQVPL
ncbi:phosphatidylinositol-glycan biosynthesis class X protein isoform X4 [Protopterus annectens]|uniref:phosphatidylinositol-glycan biosynthesis class X protein isoform X4 n=1 Tax=Protopterus annectens TaxID=7888 RepID=UPI001CFB203E|nr:phosphatidylinositol-glycan biosynthesis class X protein isoform X4 [Protopterus annectens]